MLDVTVFNSLRSNFSLTKKKEDDEWNYQDGFLENQVRIYAWFIHLVVAINGQTPCNQAFAFP